MSTSTTFVAHLDPSGERSENTILLASTQAAI